MASDSLPPAVLVRHLRGYGETRQQHARAARRGDEVRVGRGAYVSRVEWDALGRRDQLVVRLSAYARTRTTPPVFSHWSAALLHGLPSPRNAGTTSTSPSGARLAADL
ncbi:hypothetical protein [Leifsonia xyli]|uniref:hypothetical protein n=1 Tax=Leifsonia xyli TaxID=1575 RepID=UPI000B2371C0